MTVFTESDAAIHHEGIDNTGKHLILWPNGDRVLMCIYLSINTMFFLKKFVVYNIAIYVKLKAWPLAAKCVTYTVMTYANWSV